MYHGFMLPVTAEVADELAALEMQLFPDNCLNEHTLAKELTYGQGFAVFDGRRIVAYMLCRGDDYLTDIMRLGVLPEYEGMGIGSSLLRRGISLAQYVMLTVSPENERALRLYRRHGFEIVGRLKDNSGWVMGLTNRTGRDSYFIGLDL